MRGGPASALLVALAIAAPLRAQSDPRLLNAVRQAQEGQADSARASLRRLFAVTAATDSLYPQILYATAVVAADATERERSLQRIVVEYPVSPWTDDALLLLAESDYAEGNLPGATRDLERIRADFPTSPTISKAALWAARTYFDMRNQVAACRWITLGIIRAGDERDLHDQLSVQARRCGALIAASDTLVQRETPTEVATPVPSTATPPVVAAADTVRLPIIARDSVSAAGHIDTVRIVPSPVTTGPTTAPAAAARTTGFRVQLAAAGTATEASGIVRSLAGQHIDADVVQEKGYYKVRTGHFATRREAQTAASQLKARLGGGPFVVSE